MLKIVYNDLGPTIQEIMNDGGLSLTTTYACDANGNLTAKTSASEDWVYSYNVQNRLVRVEEDDLLVAEYGYDPFGRRLWKEVDGERTYFLYSDEGLVAEYDDTGNELRSYGWQPNSLWTTNPLWLKEGEDYYWYQNDHLGTPQKLVDNDGAVVWAAQYTAFGEAQIEVETVVNNLRFPGQYFDEETGLHYNWHRFYIPEMARYSRVDPIGFSGGDINLYGYVWNRPGNWIDPWGLGLQIWEFIPMEDGQKIVDEAITWVETPYVSGGSSKGAEGGADCSGSVWKIYQNAGFPFERASSHDFPTTNVPGFFRPVPGNIPQKGDVGRWPGHLLIYDPDAPGENDAWSARRPGRTFQAVPVDWWGWEGVHWYRYIECYSSCDAE